MVGRSTLVVVMVVGLGCGADAPSTPDVPDDPDEVPRAQQQPDGGRLDDAADGAAPADVTAAPPRESPQPWEDCEGTGRTLEAGPEDYRDVASSLAPGDTLRLRAGDYTRGLPLRVSGEPGRCIVVEAADRVQRPRLLGSDSFNIIAIHGASWLKVRHLDVDGLGKSGFGVAAQGGTQSPTHHVVIEDLTLDGLGGDQQVVGISTKSPAWDWVIRGNRIRGAGTGLYLGNSDGRQPFIRGVIERNTIVDTLGYNMQIKHQIERPDLPEIPAYGETIVRHNVFAKTAGSSTGGSARPNVLLGHFPAEGAGALDQYVVYANFFFDNATESLFQAEGNLLVFHNVFVNPHGAGVSIQRHNGAPREVDFFFNTLLTQKRAFRMSGGDAAFSQRARYNALYSDVASDTQEGSAAGSWSDAAAVFLAPMGSPGLDLDLHPRAGHLSAAINRSTLPERADVALDFDGHAHDADVVGAYATSDARVLSLSEPIVNAPTIEPTASMR